MIKISIYNPQEFKFDEELVISEVERTVRENSKLNAVEISLAVLPHQELVDMARKYFDDETEEELSAHPVLSFPSSEVEGPFVAPPDKINHLGEIIVSWEKADKNTKGVVELATHGTLHLLGIHHE